MGQTDFKECKFVSAPPDQTRPQKQPDHRNNQKQPRDCKLVSVSPYLTCVNIYQSVINVNSVVNHAHIAQGQPQRKGISPAVVRRQSLKYVKNVSCVDQLCFVKHAPNVAQNLPAGARLNQFWETWEPLGARTK